MGCYLTAYLLTAYLRLMYDYRTMRTVQCLVLWPYTAFHLRNLAEATVLTGQRAAKRKPREASPLFMFLPFKGVLMCFLTLEKSFEVVFYYLFEVFSGVLGFIWYGPTRLTRAAWVQGGCKDVGAVGAGADPWAELLRQATSCRA